MQTANPRQHLSEGIHARRCWECQFWTEWAGPAGAQPLGDCSRIFWALKVEGRDVRQMTHADDACTKFEATFGSIEQREETARAVGLG